jgi:hypothetical protein
MSSNNVESMPFPWRCSNCREKAVHAATVDYVATRYYEGVECTVRLSGLKTPRCQKCGQVAPDADALAVIEQAFAAERLRQASSRKSA